MVSHNLYTVENIFVDTTKKKHTTFLLFNSLCPIKFIKTLSLSKLLNQFQLVILQATEPPIALNLGGESLPNKLRLTYSMYGSVTGQEILTHSSTNWMQLTCLTHLTFTRITMGWVKRVIRPC